MPAPAQLFGTSIEAGLWLFIAILGLVAAVVAAKKKRRQWAALGDEEVPKPHDEVQRDQGDATHFIILSAARTGSTLLRNMLGSHPGVFAGGEIFNPVEIKNEIISWCEPAHARAQINQDENLMRLVTDSWSRLPGSAAPQLPTVRLPIKKFIEDVREIEAAEKLYDRCFKEHPMLEIFYEDLAQDPQAVAARALNFLGVKVSHQLDVTLEKTGVDSLRTAIENYDELKSSLLRWASFFED